jgi:predicted Fe-Mo cluster-binding NifX family protein
LIHAGDVLGGSMDEKTVSRAKKQSEKKGIGEAVDVLEMLDHAEAERIKAEEAKRRLHIVGRAKYSTQDIDPFEKLGIVPKSVPWWQRNIPATAKQKQMLERNGIPIKDMDTGRASQLIEAIMSKPSEKQAWVLRQAGIDPRGFDRKTASTAIDLVKSGRLEDAKKLAAGH